MKITTTEGWALLVFRFANLEHCSIGIKQFLRISVSTSDFSAARGFLHQSLRRGEFDVLLFRKGTY